MRIYPAATHIGRDSFRTVVLQTIAALSALHTASDVGSDTDTVAGLDMLDVVTDPDGLPDDLMSDNKGQLALAPALLEGVKVRPTDTAVGDGEPNVVGGEVLRFESGDLEVGEALRVCVCTSSAQGGEYYTT